MSRKAPQWLGLTDNLKIKRRWGQKQEEEGAKASQEIDEEEGGRRQEGRSMKSSFNEAVLRSLIMISDACMGLDILDVINTVPLSCGEPVCKCQVGFQEDLVYVFLCKLLPFLAYLSMGASVLTLTVMTI